jgi:hypothetical protein
LTPRRPCGRIAATSGGRHDPPVHPRFRLSRARRLQQPRPAGARAAGRRPGVAESPSRPPRFKLPEGSGCSGEIARWQSIQDNDRATGHVGETVYNQIRGEIAQASAACQAGKDAEARALVRASRARHGYPG